MQLFSDLLSFVKNPTYKSDDTISTTDKWIGVHILFPVCLISIMIVSAPLMTLFGIDELNHELTDLSMDMAPWQLLLLGAVMAPLWEELIFRWPIKYPFGIFVLNIALVCFGVYWIGNIFQLGIEDYTYFLIFSALAMGFGLYFFSLENKWSIHRFFVENYGKLFYGSVMTFAVIHATNFSLEPRQWLLLPIMVLPQFLIGIVLGFLRNRWGLIFAIYYHFLNNFILIGMFLLARKFLPEVAF